jgi:phospholipid/cholesterol/gamma-HCH transport system substrate-binding protein
MTSASGMSVFSHKTILYTYFQNSDGLKIGAPVNLEGVTIGEVTHVTVSSDPARKLTPVKITFKIDPKYHASVHTDSKASLSTVGVLGDTVVDINSVAAVGPEAQTGAELGTLETPNLTDVVKASQGTIESLNVILAKMNVIVDNIQQGKGTVGKLINDPGMYNKAVLTIDQLQALVTNLNEGKGSAGKLLHDDELYNRLNDTSAKLQQITTDLNNGKGSAGKLLKDETLYTNLNSTLKHANDLLAEADAGRGALGLLTKDPKFAKKLDDTVTQMDTLLTNVNTGQGTIGKLAKDPSMYNNLNTLLTSSTDLVQAVRKDPKKYLVIHLKIF